MTGWGPTLIALWYKSLPLTACCWFRIPAGACEEVFLLRKIVYLVACTHSSVLGISTCATINSTNDNFDR